MIRGWSRPSTAAWSTPRRRWGWRWGELGPVREAHTLNQHWSILAWYSDNHILHVCKYRRNQKKISFSPHVRWDCQLCPLSLGHLGNAFLPSSNHFLLALNNRNKNQVQSWQCLKWGPPKWMAQIPDRSPPKINVWDSPRVNWNGLPRSLELSTFLPFSKVNT